LSVVGIVGLTVFIIISIGAIWWCFKLLSGSNDLPMRSRREPFALGYPRASTSVDPVIVPVDDVQKNTVQLPPLAVNFGSIAPPLLAADPKTEVSPNFITSPSKIEESLLFRSLVLAMFAVSIISVDFAAGTHFSWIGIPFVTIGTIWSWYRRHDAKHWLNILVSIVSLALVFATSVPVLFKQIAPAIDLLPSSSKLAATLELTLGSIVVLLQMGLSFSLYSRRVLGYCLLISIILIGVAAGLSQNIGFFILLCGWMTIAIPTLMLDYRSRLALPPMGIASLSSQSKDRSTPIPWKYLTKLAAIAIAIGLIISIFIPNFQLPDLAFKQAGIDKLQTLAQKYKTPNSNLPSSPAPSPISSPPPIDDRALASKVLGQSGNNNYPELIKQENLQLPPELSNRLQQFTQQILATSPQPLKSDFDRSTYLAEYLKQHHQDAPPPANFADLPPLDSKLIQQSIAKCTAAPQTCKMVGNKQDLPVVHTSMLRSIGIPARLKTGEQLAQLDPQTKLYPRPPAQPPSQTEMYAPNWGWVPLDATPDRPVLNLTPQQRSGLTGLKDGQDSAIGTSSAPVSQPSSPITSPSGFRDGQDSAIGTSSAAASQLSPNDAPAQPDPNTSINHPSPPITSPAESPKLDFNLIILKTIAVTIIIVGVFALWLFRYRQQQQQLATLPPIERIYRSMLTSLSKTGNTKLPAQTQLEYAQSIKNTEHPQIAQVTAEISQLYTAWRYGNQKIEIDKLARKLQNLQHLQQLAANRQRQQWFAHQKAAIQNLVKFNQA
jgi:hypothetical protein